MLIPSRRTHKWCDDSTRRPAKCPPVVRSSITRPSAFSGPDLDFVGHSLLPLARGVRLDPLHLAMEGLAQIGRRFPVRKSVGQDQIHAAVTDDGVPESPVGKLSLAASQSLTSKTSDMHNTRRSQRQSFLSVTAPVSPLEPREVDQST
jgi:hypothetical protein